MLLVQILIGFISQHTLEHSDAGRLLYLRKVSYNTEDKNP